MSKQSQTAPSPTQNDAAPVQRPGEAGPKQPDTKSQKSQQKQGNSKLPLTPYQKLEKQVKQEILYMHRQRKPSPVVKKDVGGYVLGVLNMPSAAISMMSKTPQLEANMWAAEDLPRLLRRQQELRLIDSQGRRLDLR